jgi:glucose/arabinose dehydrogenase
VPHQLTLPINGRSRTVTLWVAEGFTIDVFASGITSARLMAESPTGEFVVTTGWGGDVFKLADRDGDGRAEDVVRMFAGMNVPHGVAFAGDVLFLAETDRILRLDRWWDPSSAREISRLPGGGHHATRSLAVGPDGKLYASIGSTCDACVEDDPMRAAVWRFELDGSGAAPYARGLRNAVGLAFEPASGALWATENERNHLGEEIPPDELNVLRAGGDYGWPACWGQRTVDPAFGSPERCAATEPPAVELPAHSAPLGLAFYGADRFPPEYAGGLFVALHGSALREDAVGYSMVYVPIENGRSGAPRDFVRGWLVGDDSWGRPVAPFVSRDGTLYVTDDKGGAIYRIRPAAVATGSRG